ncbi:MAG: SCO family protein [Gammaproteobacteria bacterium]|nr:SCO family protein [Gammaproteobacteria bacterium]
MYTANASKHYLIALMLLVVMVVTNSAFAAYGGVPKSSVDPSILKIDEKKHLGVSVDKSTVFLDEFGKEFTINDLAGKPTILLLSYYRCDGACSAINRTLYRTISGVDDWKIGKDFNVLTVSFDHNDNPQTLAEFKSYSGFDKDIPQGWTMATFKKQEDIQPFADAIGYRFFWEPRDRVFLHPSVYMVLSPEGRVTRYLYAGGVKAEDIEISLTKAKGGDISPSNLINYMVGACYSYNYEEGKYTLNYPIFIALGALLLGIVLLSWGSLITKWRVRT